MQPKGSQIKVSKVKAVNKKEVHEAMRWRLKDNRGFSLVEMMIVIAIIGILAGIAVPNLIKYSDNSNLRAAARDLMGDINELRSRAVAENRSYRLSINIGANTYTLERPAGAVYATRDITSYGSAVSFQSANDTQIDFNTRGTVDNCTIVLRNNRNSTATITINVTGRAYVTYNMQ